MTRILILVIALLALLGLQSSAPLLAATGNPPALEMSPALDAPGSLPILDQLATTSTKKKTKRKQCPDGLIRNTKTGKCFNPCSHNDHFENGKCVPCKPGFHEEVQNDDNGEPQDVCVANSKKKKSGTKASTKKCDAGFVLTDGKCLKSEFPEIENCPEGQNADPQTGVCFSCSHNDHFDPALGKCVPCKLGFHVEGDQCVAD